MGLKLPVSKQRLVFGLYLLVLIVAVEVILHRFHLPVWPVFMVMIFFFETHMNRGRAPHLIVGALTGIAAYLLTVQFVELAASTLGLATARLVVICLVVYAIVAFGEVMPVVFNNYAFMFYLVSGLAAQSGATEPLPLVWMALVVIGGSAVIVGILGIGKLVAKTRSAG